MDSRTGKVYPIENEEQFKALNEKLGGVLKKISANEFFKIQHMPEEKRPEEVALMRFMEQRETLNAPRGLEVQNAFRLGYRAAVSDQATAERVDGGQDHERDCTIKEGAAIQVRVKELEALLAHSGLKLK